MRFLYLSISLMVAIFLLCHCSQQDKFVLIADPKILAVKIIDNQEPLINLKDQEDICYGPPPEIPNNTDYTHLRKTVYEKLKIAQKLLPPGLHLCLYEGYRSLQLQKKLFNDRFETLKKQHPDWPKDQIFIETTRLVSPVINQDGSKNIPPHSTGGAIDIYLVDNQGSPVDMGIHPKDWLQDPDGSISFISSRIASREAQHYRKIMSRALSAAGFVNLPTEYWHWSYGDRYWAYRKHKSHAIYDSYNQPSSH